MSFKGVFLDHSPADRPTNPAAPIPHLRRVLSLSDLILYGIVAVTPSAPVTVYGLSSVQSRGHALDTILFAMVAMVLTAISYGRMGGALPFGGFGVYVCPNSEVGA